MNIRNLMRKMNSNILDPSLLANIKRRNFVQPVIMQQYTIPLALEGRFDFSFFIFFLSPSFTETSWCALKLVQEKPLLLFFQLFLNFFMQKKEQDDLKYFPLNFLVLYFLRLLLLLQQENLLNKFTLKQWSLSEEQTSGILQRSFSEFSVLLLSLEEPL